MAHGRIRDWLMASRTSVRLAFLLRLVSMGVSTLLSLLWTPLLLRSMGKELYGLFTTFQAVPRLGGLGDLGLSSAIAIRAGQMVGLRDYESLRNFLVSARAVVAVVAPALTLFFLLLSPFLPRWLDFQQVPGSGSMVLLFQTGAVYLLFMIVGGYFLSLNTAYGTTTWPVLPTLLFSQMAVCAHWLLARSGSPLWMQHLPYVASVAALAFTGWLLLKAAHPWLSELRPVRFNWSIGKELIATSCWGYLYGISNLIYTMTDRLIIQAGFGPAAVPRFLLNLKFCELALQLILSSTFAGLPKITHWIASSEPEHRARALIELRRLNICQILLGCGAALVYLVANDAFVQFWVGAEYVCPPLWQWAFAMNLAVTVSGDVGVQVAGLCGRDGLRKAALAIGATGVLNLTLSVAAMKLGSIFGIALATVVAQSLASIILARQTCRHLGVPVAAWLLRSWIVPVLSISAAFWLRTMLPPDNWRNTFILAGSYLMALVLIARVIGFNKSIIQHEWQSLRKIFPGRG